MKLTQKNLRFTVCYTRSEYWDIPEVDGEDFEWEGDTQVEQKLYGILNARQFLWLVLDNGMDETINTQGLGIKNGYIIPAVNFYDSDEKNSCYVSVHTDGMLKLALSQSQEPAPTPVLQNDFSIKNEKLSFVEAEKVWGKMVDALPEIISSLKEGEEFGYYIDDDTLDMLVPKLIKKLNSVCVQ